MAGFLYRSGGAWSIGLCSVRSRAQLDAGISPLPAPDGTPPARLLAGGDFGAAQLATLDDGGRVLAYADGRGTVVATAACGDRVRVVTRAGPHSRLTLQTRTLPDLDLESSRALGPQRGRVIAVGCDTVFFNGHLERGRRTVWSGRAGEAVLAGGLAFVRNLLVDSRTGETQRIAPAGARPLALSPDSTRMVYARRNGLLITDIGDGRVLARRSGFTFRAVWLDDDALAAGDGSRTRFYDARLHVTGRAPRSMVTSARIGEDELALADNGTLRRYGEGGTRLGSFPLFSPAITTLSTLPGSGIGRRSASDCPWR